MNSSKANRLLLIAAATAALAACGKTPAPPPPAPAPAPAPAPMPAPAPAPAPAPTGTTLVSVELGKQVDAAGKLIGAPQTAFGEKDTIYAVVTTNNAGTNPATIAAHWEYQGGSKVNDSSQQVAASGETITTFHVENPGGWPTGHYKVEISIDGKPVATKEFGVE